MPAIRAVPSTSPLGASPRATIAAVSGLMRITARARARRSLSGLAPDVHHARAAGAVQVGQTVLAHTPNRSALYEFGL